MAPGSIWGTKSHDLCSSVCLVPPFQKQGDVTMCKWWSRSEENLIIDPLTDAVSCRW